MMIPVGAASADLEVPPGTRLDGFAARTALSTGTHDPITVRALVLGEVGLVTVDCCALHEETCRAIESRLAGTLQAVVVAATHTHSGPVLADGRLGGADRALLDALVALAATVLARAASETEPCTVSYAAATGIGIAHDRRDPGNLVDPPAQLVRCTAADGRVRAQLLSYPCHPVVVGSANTLLSGDYPAVVRARLAEAAPGSTVLYASGTCGDLNTGHSAEASFTAAENPPERTFDQATRLGRRLAEAVLAAPASRIRGTEAVAARFAPIDLDIDTVPRQQAADEAVRWRAAAADPGADAGAAAVAARWADWAESVARGRLPGSWSGRVGVIGVGDLRIVTLPGEPFLRTGEIIRALRKGPTIVLGYCDGVPGYLPRRPDYPHGGYEVRTAHRYYNQAGPFVPGSAERIERAAARLLIED